MPFSWHQERAAGMHRTSDNIVGYTYGATMYCPACIVSVLPTGEGGAFDGWALAPGVSMSTETNLDEIAAAFSINREDEATFDGSEFPKVVLRDMARGTGEGDTDPNYWETGGDDYADRCGRCHKMLDA
jgi:hypothetical protein